MDEFKFVLKCFVFACALLALSQLKTSGETIEAHIQSTLVSSSVADFLNKSAEGGVKFIKKATEATKTTVNGWIGSHGSSEPVRQLIRYPAAKKTVDNSDLKNGEISHDADFGYESDLE